MATSRLSALFGPAAAVADAILYEGYLLYPYRRSSAKNKVRWQFGVLLPREWAQAHGLSDAGVAGSAESWWQQTECLVVASTRDRVHVRLRFLQLQRRSVERRAEDGGYRAADRVVVAGREEFGFDEAVPREADIAVSMADLLTAESVTGVSMPSGRDVEPLIQPGTGEVGRVVRRREAVSATVRLSAQACGPPDGLARLRVRVENSGHGLDRQADRDVALGRALLAAHTLLAVPGGSFVSQMDPPDWARGAASGCRNVHTFPVLAGPETSASVMLSSPIILYDHPQVAPESPLSLHDATEIDEILSLRTLTLTEQEKAEARATDPRAAAIVDRVGALPPDGFARLHGAIRSRTPMTPPEEGLWTRSSCSNTTIAWSSSCSATTIRPRPTRSGAASWRSSSGSCPNTRPSRSSPSTRSPAGTCRRARSTSTSTWPSTWRSRRRSPRLTACRPATAGSQAWSRDCGPRSSTTCGTRKSSSCRRCGVRSTRKPSPNSAASSTRRRSWPQPGRTPAPLTSPPPRRSSAPWPPSTTGSATGCKGGR